jgi:hypothetical protein
MLHQQYLVPFSISANSGFLEVNGLIRTEKDAVLLEYQSADAIIGIVKSGLKTKRIPFSSIRKLDFKKGWFSTRLTLHTNSMSDLEGIPGAESGSVTFNIKKAHRIEAMELNSHFQMQFSEYKIHLLDEQASKE